MIEIVDRGSIFHAPTMTNGFAAWPDIAAVNGGLVCTFSGYRRMHVGYDGHVMISYSKTANYWSMPQIFCKRFGADERDPGVCGDPRGGFFVTWFCGEFSLPEYHGQWCQHSNWKQPRKTTLHTPHGCIWYKNAFHMLGVTGKSARIVFGKFDKLGKVEEVGEVPCDRSSDEWHWTEPHVTSLSDTTLIGFIRREPSSKRDWVDHDSVLTIWKTISADGGKTWSEPCEMGIRGGPPHVMIAEHHGQILTYAQREKPYSIRIDNGKGPEIIDDNIAKMDHGYPATCQIGADTFITVYYAARKRKWRTGIFYTMWRIK